MVFDGFQPLVTLNSVPEVLTQTVYCKFAYEFIGFGAMDCNSPFDFIGFGSVDSNFCITSYMNGSP